MSFRVGKRPIIGILQAKGGENMINFTIKEITASDREWVARFLEKAGVRQK